jgi:ankyrin repeat protein
VIELIAEHVRSETSRPSRALTISLLWHILIDSWNLDWSSPSATVPYVPCDSSSQSQPSDWTNDYAAFWDTYKSCGKISDTRYRHFEPTLSARFRYQDLALEDRKFQGQMRARPDVATCLGIKHMHTHTLAEHNDSRSLELRLRPFVLERQPGETKKAFQAMMDPYSVASMQILTSYMALLLSNDLLYDNSVQNFVTRALEMPRFEIPGSLFKDRSPSARTVATRILHAAIEIGATGFLTQALNSGAEVESPSVGRESFTLLQRALKMENYEAARVLIEAKADVNPSTSAGSYVSICAAEDHIDGFICICEVRDVYHPLTLASKSYACVDLIPNLLGRGAKVSQINPVLSQAIIAKASTETVSCLIDAGADVNLCLPYMSFNRDYVSTPLSAAVLQNNLEIVNMILKAGAFANAPFKAGLNKMSIWQFFRYAVLETPLLCAISAISRFDASSDIYDVVQLLMESGADPNISLLDLFLISPEDWEEYHAFPGVLLGNAVPHLFYPMQAAVAHDSIELVKLLLHYNASARPLHGTPLLALAARKSNIEMIRLLLSNGADPKGLNTLQSGQTPLEAAVDSESLDIIDLLLIAGANIDCPAASYGGRTPLQRAAENGDERMIDHLLSKGASMLPQPAPFRGSSVLQGFIQNGLHDYVADALRLRASPNRCHDDESSPLAVAVMYNDTASVKILLSAGADVHDYAYSERESQKDPEKLWEFSPKRMSSIQWAAVTGNLDIAKLLLDAGADVNQRPSTSSDGAMALHQAAKLGNYNMTKFLIEHEADVNALSNRKTALWNVLAHHNTGSDDEILKLLLENGSNPNQLSQDHDRGIRSRSSIPLERACRYRNISAVEILLCAGADANQSSALSATFDRYRYANYDSGRAEKILTMLLRHGCDVNHRSHEDSTALQAAIQVRDFNCADILMNAGALINAPASTSLYGRTALQAAAEAGNVDLVERLLLAGAHVDVPAVDYRGVTALQAAAIRGYLPVAKILLEHGATIDAPASIEWGMTAIDGAAEFGRMDVVKLLLDNYDGATPFSEVRESAYWAAKKGNQWYVMEFLSAYKHPSELKPRESEPSAPEQDVDSGMQWLKSNEMHYSMASFIAPSQLSCASTDMIL